MTIQEVREGLPIEKMADFSLEELLGMAIKAEIELGNFIKV